MKNFINPQTGMRFYIPAFRTTIRNGVVIYTDLNGVRLMDGNTPLEKLGTIRKHAVFTDEKKRI